MKIKDRVEQFGGRVDIKNNVCKLSLISTCNLRFLNDSQVFDVIENDSGSKVFIAQMCSLRCEFG